MKNKRIARTLRMVAATAALAAALLGSRVALAGNSACRAECRKDRGACVEQCTKMSGCAALYQKCTQRCVNTTFGEDRGACIGDCKDQRTECRQFQFDCKVGCQSDFLSCKVACGS